ncbi:MAG TPA: CsbD family protein [bacterium]|nr:CsbD family protein [bacterium]
MNRDQLKGKWRQLRGHVKKQWGKLTDDDLEQVEGDYDKLLGKIQERYGIAREEAERRLKEFDHENAARGAMP